MAGGPSDPDILQEARVSDAGQDSLEERESCGTTKSGNGHRRIRAGVHCPHWIYRGSMPSHLLVQFGFGME
jgi:hypothetical protein